MKKRRRRRRRFTKRQLHNIRAICMWIACALILFLIIFGCVKGVKAIRQHYRDWRQAKIEEQEKEEAAAQAEKEAQELAEKAEKEAQELAEKAKTRKVNLVMVGDMLLHESIENRSLQADGTYDYSDIFSQLKDDISDADVALVNEEVIIGGDQFGVQGYPTFNAPSDLTDGLADAGFDVVLHATNHASDMGTTGIQNCLEIWAEKHPEMEILGIHDSETDAGEIYVWEKNEVRIAFLNYTTFMNTELKSDSSYMVDEITAEREAQVRSDIQQAREMADFVVVCPHWGTEDSYEVTQEQKDWAQIFLEEGVDLVIGTHPHVIQPVEMMTDPDTGHQMLVYYSIGNFISWVSNGSDTSIAHLVGGMPQVKIGQLEDGSVGILDYSVKATICHFTGTDDDVVVYPFSEYTDELAGTHHIKTYQTDFSREYVSNYLDSVWGDLWE